MSVSKKVVQTKKSYSHANDFRYRHPRVSIGEEFEPEVSVYTLGKSVVNIGLKKAFFSTEENEYINNISSRPGIEELDKKKSSCKYLSGHVLDLVTPGANLYSHWLLDLLPKLMAVKRAGLELSSFDYIYVNYYNSKFKREAFDKLGIPKEKVLDFPSAAKIFSCSKITTVTSCRSALYTPDWVAKGVRSLFLDNPEMSDKVGSRRLYISRSKGDARRILNEAELMESISPLGFKVLYCEDWTVQDVALMMSEAEIVIAPHGAGLANLVFCNSRAKVIEIFSSHMSSEYYKMSKIFGFDYLCINALSPSGDFVDLSQLNYEDERHIIHPMNILLSKTNIEEIVNYVHGE